MFPLEEGPLNDLGSSEAQSHLSYSQFIIIGQEIKLPANVSKGGLR